MASRTFRLDRSLTLVEPLMTLETVPDDTPASLASSFCVGAMMSASYMMICEVCVVEVTVAFEVERRFQLLPSNKKPFFEAYQLGKK